MGKTLQSLCFLFEPINMFKPKVQVSKFLLLHLLLEQVSHLQPCTPHGDQPTDNYEEDINNRSGLIKKHNTQRKVIISISVTDEALTQ